jgi:hypothetical protein
MDPDAELSKAIRDAIGPESSEYAVSLLDISDPENPVYAEINGDTRRNVGSVGKMVVGLAWFQALADVYPDDIEARERLMREPTSSSSAITTRWCCSTRIRTSASSDRSR